MKDVSWNVSALSGFSWAFDYQYGLNWAIKRMVGLNFAKSKEDGKYLFNLKEMKFDSGDVTTPIMKVLSDSGWTMRVKIFPTFIKYFILTIFGTIILAVTGVIFVFSQGQIKP